MQHRQNFVGGGKTIMTDFQTVSWIFLATALSSQECGANVAAISELADGINHAVPTQKELQVSLKWLLIKGLIRKDQSKYSLTDQGNELIQQAEKRSNILLKLWEILEADLKTINEKTLPNNI